MPPGKQKIKVHPLSFLLRFVANWKKWPQIFPIPVQEPLQCDFAASSIRGWSLAPPFEPELGHAICSGQWHLSKHDLSRDPKSTCTLGLTLWSLESGRPRTQGCLEKNEITQGRELGFFGICFYQMRIMTRDKGVQGVFTGVTVTVDYDIKIG